jgi:hypothetical protein
MKIRLITSLIVFYAINAHGQLLNPRAEYKNGISLYGVGPNAIGSISYDYFISPNVSAEAGIGFIGVHAGIKYHFGGTRPDLRWTPYFGGSFTRSLFPSVGLDYLPYFPIGLQYIGKNKFNFAFEVAPVQFKFSAWNVVGIKLGRRF